MKIALSKEFYGFITHFNRRTSQFD